MVANERRGEERMNVAYICMSFELLLLQSISNKQVAPKAGTKGSL